MAKPLVDVDAVKAPAFGLTDELSPFTSDWRAHPGAPASRGRVPGVLARRFEEEARTTWRRFLHDARMLRAMALLAEDEARVTQTAYAVGYERLAALPPGLPAARTRPAMSFHSASASRVRLTVHEGPCEPQTSLFSIARSSPHSRRS